LNMVSDADFSNDKFPFGTAQWINIGMSTVYALRITYVGELGWELHIPSSMMVNVYDTLIQAGEQNPSLQVTNAGHYAINSLRMEKGYRAWGSELSPVDTAVEAGLAFAVDWKKEIFVGRNVLLDQKTNGVNRKLVIFVLDDPEPVLWGSETIFRDGKPVSYTTSAAYAHSLGKAIGFGYVKNSQKVDAQFINTGHYEIEISGKRYSAKPFLQPPYDPKRVQILS